MKKVCAWCGQAAGPADAPALESVPVTHGLCDTCAAGMLAEMSEPLIEFLDRVGLPVLLIDHDCLVQSANRAAQALLGKGLDQVAGQRPGNVIECLEARKPGGCGHQVCCQACAIRRTVTDTYMTGRPHLRVPACREVHTTAEPLQADLLISTEKVGEMVLLRIDELALTTLGQPVLSQSPGSEP